MISYEDIKRKYAYSQPVFPYFNVDYSMAIYPSDLRYRMLTGVTQKTIRKGNISPILVNHYPELDIARWYAATVLMNMISERGLSYNYIEAKTGTSKSLISKMSTKEIYFRVPIAAWEALCHKVLGISVHSLIFGEECKIFLPNRYAVPLGFLEEYADALYVDMLLNYTKKIYESYCQERKCNKFGHYKSNCELQHERIGELRESAGLYKSFTFGCGDNGTETPSLVKTALNSFWNGPRGFKYYMIAYTAMYYRIAVDYITCDMPCRMNRVFGIAHDNSHIELSNKLKTVADYMLAVDEEGKRKILNSIWAHILQQIRTTGASFV